MCVKVVLYTSRSVCPRCVCLSRSENEPKNTHTCARVHTHVQANPVWDDVDQNDELALKWAQVRVCIEGGASVCVEKEKEKERERERESHVVCGHGQRDSPA